MNIIVFYLSVKLLGHVTSTQDVCFAPFLIVFFQDFTFMFLKWHTVQCFFKKKLPEHRINTVNVKEHRPCSFLCAVAWHTVGDTVLENHICYKVSGVCVFLKLFLQVFLSLYRCLSFKQPFFST